MSKIIEEEKSKLKYRNQVSPTKEYNISQCLTEPSCILKNVNSSKMSQELVNAGKEILFNDYSSLRALKQKNKNFSLRLKNSMILPLNSASAIPFDLNLINTCKRAIVQIKDDLPNYREVINKLNKKFDIEEGDTIYIKMENDNFYQKHDGKYNLKKIKRKLFPQENFFRKGTSEIASPVSIK